MKFGQIMTYYKRKFFFETFYKMCSLKTSSRPFCVCKEQRIKQNTYWEMTLLKEATYVRYVLKKLSKFDQISTYTSSDSILESIVWNFYSIFLIKGFLL